MRKLSRAEISVILLVFTLFCSVVALIHQSRRATDEVIERAFTSAEDLVDFVMVANRHYIQSLSVLPVDQLTAYPDREPDKPWLPATFATRYTSAYSAQKQSVDFRIYSGDPFSFNRERVLDGFGQDALAALLPGNASSHRAIEELGDGAVRVRLARPFRMDKNCVACHNRPEWGLNNQDWEAGDVRGVWEASVYVDPVKLHTDAQMFALLVLIAVAFLLGVFIVFPAVRHEVRNRVFFHNRSIAMERVANRNLVEAHTDALTGLGNRRFLDAELKPLVEMCSGSDEKMAAVIFDIDHFKRVNDTHGHDVGDFVIRTTAEIIQRETRSSDRLARMGGEEFVVLAPELNHGGVLNMAERIRNSLESYEFVAEGRSFKVTMSGGVAFLRDGETGEELLKRADERLYEAKSQGRNRIIYHPDRRLAAGGWR